MRLPAVGLLENDASVLRSFAIQFPMKWRHAKTQGASLIVRWSFLSTTIQPKASRHYIASCLRETVADATVIARRSIPRPCR
jgi:hypothetical protein